MGWVCTQWGVKADATKGWMEIVEGRKKKFHGFRRKKRKKRHKKMEAEQGRGGEGGDGEEKQAREWH